jgi:glutathione S-transferase
LILHHCDFSSFSEKVRLVLGIKGIPWSSVSIPSSLPKPDYMPLSGGYRRASSLQIGADIFCDSVRIIAELEDRFPEPSIYPVLAAPPSELSPPRSNAGLLGS